MKGNWRVTNSSEECTIYAFWSENHKGRGHIKLDVKQDGREWTEFIWLRIRTSGGFL
jgi:hypothetical protein